MKRPTQQQIDTALMWLESNEGEGGERESCLAVANWIKAQQSDAMLRSAARKSGVSVVALRRRLREHGDESMTNAELAQRLSALDWSNTSLQHQLAISAAVTSLGGTAHQTHHYGAPRHVDNVIDLTEVFQRERAARDRTVRLLHLNGTPFASRAFVAGPADAPWAWIAETVSKELGCAKEAVGCVDPNLVTVDGLPCYVVILC